MTAPLARAGAVLIAALLLGAAAPCGAQWFDALLMHVNGEPVLVSDVDMEEALFGSGKSYEEMDATAREAAAVTQIRRRLLLAEARRFGVARPDEKAVAREAEALRQGRPQRTAWISPDALRDKVRDRLWVEDFVDTRIRSFVMIRDTQVEAALSAQGGPNSGESEADARERIRGELRERETARRLDRYLTRLYNRADIHRYPVPEPDF